MGFLAIVDPELENVLWEFVAFVVGVVIVLMRVAVLLRPRFLQSAQHHWVLSWVCTYAFKSLESGFCVALNWAGLAVGVRVAGVSFCFLGQSREMWP